MVPIGFLQYIRSGVSVKSLTINYQTGPEAIVLDKIDPFLGKQIPLKVMVNVRSARLQEIPTGFQPTDLQMWGPMFV